MVVFADLSEDDVDTADSANPRNGHRPFEHRPKSSDLDLNVAVEEGQNCNWDSLFAAALGCYPIVSVLASYLDLNTLHDLSSTCRQVRANLLQFRSQLVKHSLRCINEEQDLGPKLADRFRESQQAWGSITGTTSFARRPSHSDRITTGRVGRCARDMVGECNRCGVIICRNCTIKSPSVKSQQDRHRRLCRTCLKAPLEYHMLPIEHEADADTLPSTPQATAGSNLEHDPFDAMVRHTSTPQPHSPPKTVLPPLSTEPPAFTASAFYRHPCTCSSMVYLCHGCGWAMRTADVTYQRGWSWRTRYSTYLGGLGTGIGEGNEGVACGREATCLNSKEVEKEVDASASELAQIEKESHEGEGRQWVGTSFFTQETVGIGGKLKKKIKKRIRVGAVVKEYEDERETSNFLIREKTGANRSWCAWCERVVVGIKDIEPQDKSAKKGKTSEVESSPGTPLSLRPVSSSE